MIICRLLVFITVQKPPGMINIQRINSIKMAGIPETMKTQLDALSSQIFDTQFEVDRQQAVVDALSEKYKHFQSYLNLADSRRDQALSNKSLIDQLVQNVLNLLSNSSIALDQVQKADRETRLLVEQISGVMGKFTHSAELINKLSNLIIRKKALNPLISDELITMVGVAGNEVNNAMSLMLIALKATFAAHPLVIKSEKSMALEYLKAKEVLSIITGLSSTEFQDDEVILAAKSNKSLYSLLHHNYETAKAEYDTTSVALSENEQQLNKAKSELSRWQIKLKSQEAGLAAAKAAVLSF